MPPMKNFLWYFVAGVAAVVVVNQLARRSPLVAKVAAVG